MSKRIMATDSRTLPHRIAFAAGFARSMEAGCKAGFLSKENMPQHGILVRSHLTHRL